jgi:hypothetical protein
MKTLVKLPSEIISGKDKINGLSISLNIFDVPAFLGEILDNITLFMIPENDVNKMRKKISVEVLRLIGSGKPKESLRFFDHKCKTHNPYTPGGMNELTALRSLGFFSI